MSDLNEKNLNATRLEGRAPPNAGGLSQTLEQAREFASHAALGELVRYQFLIVVEELVTNIVTHGQPEQDTEISYEFSAGGDAIQLRLSDSGVPFDPRNLVIPPEVENEPNEQEGGWGWPLILKWCDLETYEHVDGKNVLGLSIKTSAL